MATFKQVDGDYVITTLNNNDSIILGSNNVLASGDVTAVGNISANNLSISGSGVINGNLTVVGNLSATGNIAGDKIFSGTTSIEIQTPGGNANISIGGLSNVAVFSTAGLDIAGHVIASGNVIGGNLTTANAVVAGSGSITGNLAVGNLNLAGNVTSLNVTGNITADNITALANLYGTITTPNQTRITQVGQQGYLDVVGNITAGNVFSFGNVVGDYVLGDGRYLTNITAVSNLAVSFISNATSIFQIQSAGGPMLAQVGGVGNVVIITTTGANVTGDLDASGNIEGNYILGNGSFLTGVSTSSSNINNGTSYVSVLASGGNIQANIAGNTVLVLDSTGANVTGTLNATGNANVGNLSATNIVGTLTTAAQPNITGVGTLDTLSVTGNATMGNIGTAGVLSVTGNANVGNLSATNIVGTLTTAAQPNITSLGTLTSLASSGTISGRGSLTVGNTSTGNSIWSVQDQAGTIVQEYGRQDGTASSPAFDFHSGATATDYDARIQATGGTGVTGQGNLSLQAANFNITATTIVTGNISASNLSVSTGTISVGNIVNTNSNGVGNIGSSSTYFNTVFAQSTSAQYADLAEIYLADQEYAPGTVVVFGGEKEITTTTVRADARVAGAVSTNPAYLMNSQASGLAVALRGKIPVHVMGPVNKGDSLVTSDTAGFAESVGTDRTYGQSVFAKSLETNLESGEKIIIAIIL